ncbi:MAG: Tol-Pal system beta propeller repeat protein TolB [Gammaproteobacteria bacterium]|nr:Tol-Pal system beta propeller repeat protein TolB [Gammaproteobacteria bacterium]NNF48954.1 Tol-Pal system beta propeller repeat protein TolB [Woeseiaceae bacterium]MBT8093643.1 Tol-Pal system beta propeller repeat protein TolB [Gammaproteobacteria bacterium]MBT8106295.1 Tol-Pal system beta propeller repeat protein TolB [Gammaproteobacteria bacterium]NNK26309.1 Tol-Pal system beta propeller repeat protein TolB [Woeseiaceae bacterium]
MVLLGLFAASTANADLVIDVQGIAQPTPVAIVPFGWEGQSASMPLDVSQVVTDDLRRSGRFDPIGEDKMLQKPTDGADVDFQDWSFVGVEAVVVGTVEQTGDDQYTLQFQLFDVFGRRQLVGYRMPRVTRATMRGAAHRVADMIYEKLTGIKGVFGTRVAYVTAKQQGNGRLYSLIVSDQDGYNEHTVMESRDPIMSPAWSPDSRQLAYVSFEGSRSSIWVQTLRTGNRFRVSADPGINGAPSFSPDGRKLVVTLGGVDGNLDIFVLDINSKRKTRLTTHRAIDTEGSWSPDGDYVYFTSDRSGGPQVYRVAAAGGTPERVTFEGSYNARPRLSPDGNKLAMVHNDRGNYRIAVMDLEHRDLLVLSTGRQDESPSFAPNSDILIYATRQGRNGVLETVSADGLIRQKLVPRVGGDVREPVWSPFPRF